MIQVTRTKDLDKETSDMLGSYINLEFGHIPIVQETEWSEPDWTLVLYIDNEIATFCNIIERNIEVDGKIWKAAGVNNVITPRNFRGKGFATKILKKKSEFFFNTLDCDLGVLFCADDLISFYKRLGWYLIGSPVFIEQSSGPRVWESNTMLLSQEISLNSDRINLKGLPW